jgi:pSer/pThr/pTyr-binding forkhead associated (FHA) protein/ribosomal protein L37AE/L43A
MKLKVGREPSNDCVIFDPKKRVSRLHLEVEIQGNNLLIADHSSNGTYVNGIRIQKNKPTVISSEDKITLGVDYVFNLSSFPAIKNLLGSKQSANKIPTDDCTMVFQNGDKTVIFDGDKTQIGDLIKLGNVKSVLVGRAEDAEHKVNHTSVSRKHCELKYVSESLFSIYDLGSSNGTFVDGQKLLPKKVYTFSSAATIKLGEHVISIKDVLPNIEIIQKVNKPETPNPKGPITPDELASFNELQAIWTEYDGRIKKAAQISQNSSTWASAFAVMNFIPGIGPILGISGSILTRYLSNKKANELKGDENYEDIFLETYACPRCKNSFQKRPWKTIRECVFCKIKFK